ncbi:MAG TPA: hypothetical protein VJS64_17545, partial [Pyrinomonadaceae bacterium]|nr:hypothetical protein [Pyrinomonadaceae bacterium]
ELSNATDELFFRNSYAGLLGLSERMSRVEAQDSNGSPVKVDKRAPGEFKAARKVARFSYDVDLTAPTRAENMSHVSWLSAEHGLLMPADLLPRPPRNAANFAEVQVALSLPDGWTTTTNIEESPSRQFSTGDPDTAVFLIGPALRREKERPGPGRLVVTTSGKWPFSYSQLQSVANRIITEYSAVTGSKMKWESFLMLVSLPGDLPPQRWTAETRGNAVVLLLGNRASRKQLLTRIAILLTHELFHLWVPNSLKLAGDYDWFFEGFTLYQALLTDMRLGLISFDDYLETIGRVYQSYLGAADRDRLSLLEASERRWTTSPSLVYDKGMLVAFLYDLKLRQASDCQSSVSGVYRDLFLWQPTGHENANETIIRLLSKPVGMDGFIKDSVTLRGGVDFKESFSKYGLEVKPGDSRSRLSVSNDLNQAQRKLLRCLGYKN